MCQNGQEKEELERSLHLEHTKDFLLSQIADIKEPENHVAKSAT